MIRVVFGFTRTRPEELLATGYNVVKCLTGNLNFPTLPVDLNDLKSELDAYSVTIGEAKDGSRKAILLRNQQGESIIRKLRSLASYVEIQCKDDLNVFLTSGFQPRSQYRPAPQALDQPLIAGLEQGPSGTLMARILGVRKAKTYECRFGVVGSDGAGPTLWSSVTVPHARSAAAIPGLTPGLTYAIQVRAYGALGYTEWSPSAMRMAI
jgi:hypothetical protein